MKRLLVMDGSSLFFRAFYALPLLKTKAGHYTNAVYGFISMMENAIREVEPTHSLICFDRKGQTFRHQLYEDYKGTREKMPTEFEQQWPVLMEILKLMNVAIVDDGKYEADDLAGTVAAMAEEEGFETYLLTGDKDYFQLISEKTKVLLTKKGITNLEVYDVERLRDEYDLSPEQMIDLKGLMGDSSDNIPGVPGIGEKTGLKLLHEFETLENIYQHLDQVSGKKRVENLTEFKAQAFLSRKLGTIIRNVPLSLTLEDMERREYNLEELRQFYREYEFNTLLQRLPDEEKEGEVLAETLELMDLEALVASLEGERILAKVFSDDEAHDYDGSQYLLLSDGTHGGVAKLGFEEMDALRELLEDERELVTFEEKHLIIYGLQKGYKLRGFTFDTAVAAYLIDPSRSNYSADYLINLMGNVQMPTWDELFGRGKTAKSVGENEEGLLQYATFIHRYGLKLAEKQEEQLKATEMWSLFRDIEMPLMEVLCDMQRVGMAVDRDVLEEQGREVGQALEVLTRDIHQLAGREFNIASPKQLGEILFDEMGLTPIKKTKTGYSTSVDVLEKLVEEDPIIEKILEYRQLSKLKSTYIDGLMEYIEEDGRVHSTFQQTIAATGRISSTEPNLQNIPIKTELGRAIRKAFPATEGHIFVDGDYSQIELRVLAHISGDEVMNEAFQKGEDIHRTTASQVFKVAPEEVTPLMRSQAKAVNFGIVYGISDYGLSQNLNIPRKEAKHYIDQYLDHFPGVRQFMKDIVAKGKEDGYVETLFHRRRYIPELNAKNFSIRSFGERVALNTPIQGSAADIIKKAMVAVYKKLKEGGYKSRLILQIHDELMIEAAVEEKDQMLKLLRETMEEVMELSVPLKVDVGEGASWYESK
ncbi:MAG: DNA polymerase I [Tissierellia bacterium]|nr:DNA polymerase I [Tissierellia bacterium]